ncbi:hypothetical protein BGZ49_001983 [Haplosporangium sp. Z 27]|nr:hypothetical protein BGZ49_001983 [Haplosporangium sp. Z 27]
MGLSSSASDATLYQSKQKARREKTRLVRAQSLVEGKRYSNSSLVSKLETIAQSPMSPYDALDGNEVSYRINRSTSLSSQSSGVELPNTQKSQMSQRSGHKFSDRNHATSSSGSFERFDADSYILPLNSKTVDNISFTQSLAVPIPTHESSSSSLRGYKFKSPSPPPSLLSPSLTTTKVSRSSSTVHGTVGQGVASGMTLHVRTESEGSKFDENTKSRVEVMVQPPVQRRPASEDLVPNMSHPDTPSNRNTWSAPVSSEARQDPQSPVLCVCERHYRNAILSIVVPISLETCFELLFSGQGAGQDDTLICAARRNANGSTDVAITTWEADKSENIVVGPTEWENRKRQLEYSVLFKIPMLAKTSTACIETQEVLQHSPDIICLHSESKIPNVPYGEQFLTVDQICMTRDSPGNTRIKCFTEIKFKKSILLASKVEAASLEVSGGFYRELIRQLVDVAEAQSNSMVVRPVLPASFSSELLIGPSTVSSEITTNYRADDLKNDNQSEVSRSTLIQHRPSGISAAQSLLSQQYLKNPPTISRHPKPSTPSISTFTEFTLPTKTSKKTKIKGKDTITTLKSPQKDSPPDCQESANQHFVQGTSINDKDSKPSLKATELWSEFMRKGLELLNKIGTDSPRTQPTIGQATDNPKERKVTGDDAESDSSRIENKSSSTGESSTISKDKKDTVNSNETEQTQLDIKPVPVVEKRQTQPKSISRIVLWTFTFGLIISILNVWRLLNTVSSVAQIIHTKNLANDPQIAAFGGSMISQHIEKQAYLVPLQIQTDMLRAEIMELMELLESQKKLRQFYKQSETVETP